jgi:hypothetical protein
MLPSRAIAVNLHLKVCPVQQIVNGLKVQELHSKSSQTAEQRPAIDTPVR